MAMRGLIVEKWSLKALESSLDLEIMEPASQPQFFHRCIVGATGSKFVNGLPCFLRITFRLNKSIRIIRCFRSLDVIVYCISQLFVLCPVAWIILLAA